MLRLELVHEEAVRIGDHLRVPPDTERVVRLLAQLVPQLDVQLLPGRVLQYPEDLQRIAFGSDQCLFYWEALVKVAIKLVEMVYLFRDVEILCV